MRRVIPSPRDQSAVCTQCGRRGPGCFWESFYKVLDFGVPTMEPVEPGDLGEGVRCDDCETRRRIEADYATDPALAARIYGAETVEEAVKRYGG